MPRVFVVTGVQAAGKSTVAALLARRYPRAVHVAGDEIRAMVVSGRVDMTPQASEEGRSKIAYDASWSVENLRRILMEETPRYGWWLDSGGQTPDETVTDILADLGASAMNPGVGAVTGQ